MEKILNLIADYFNTKKRIDDRKKNISNLDRFIDINTSHINFDFDGNAYFALESPLKKKRIRKSIEKKLRADIDRLEIIRHKLYLLEKQLDKINEEIVPGRDFDGDEIFIRKDEIA